MRSTCLGCNRWRSSRLHAAVALSAPTNLLTLTLLTGVWDRDKDMVARLREYLARDGFDLRMFWAVEANPKGTGYHAHAFVYLLTVDQPQPVEIEQCPLHERAQQVGLGLVLDRPVTYQGDFGYVLKAATWNEASLVSHRLLNGNDLVHSRRFFRQGVGGVALTQRQAMQAAVGGRPDEEYLYEPPVRRRHLGSALTPQQAARIRSHGRGAVHRTITSAATGEVLVDVVEKPLEGPLPPVGVIDQVFLLVRLPGHPTRLLDGVHPGGVPVIETLREVAA